MSAPQELLLTVLLLASFMLSWTLIDALAPPVNRWRERRRIPVPVRDDSRE
jgi:hypothetical protein